MTDHIEATAGLTDREVTPAPHPGTYHVSAFENFGHVAITCFGSDADTARKRWRSIGVTSVPAAELAASIEVLERNGWRRETRSPAEMATAER